MTKYLRALSLDVRAAGSTNAVVPFTVLEKKSNRGRNSTPLGDYVRDFGANYRQKVAMPS